MTKILSQRGYEVWINYDRSAKVYELFAEREAVCYLGCADDRAEAKRIGQRWIDQRRQES